MKETMVEALLAFTFTYNDTRTIVQTANDLYRKVYGRGFPFKSRAHKLKAQEAYNCFVRSLRVAAPTVKVTLHPLGVQLVNTCRHCGETHTVDLTWEKWGAWIEAMSQGGHTQDSWTELSPAEREEFFISGLCGACWEKIFSEE